VGVTARDVLGVLVGLVARLWLSTLRVRVVADESLARNGARPWIMAFFHGTQWPLLAWSRRRPTVVMVSWSKDGRLQARALATLGFSVVRGSSSNGGARGLATIVRRLRAGESDAVFAVDGPRGPYGVAKRGARAAARAVGGVVVPVGAAVARGMIVGRAWDRFVVAWPFSRVVIWFGPVLEPRDIATEADEPLTAAIAEANRAAELALAGLPSVAIKHPADAGLSGATK
jgi:lysophospholipid acyltransferase (LPLAT)-like uncharacterized protein